MSKLSEDPTGLLFIVCGPSGVGKTSLGKVLRAQTPELVLSVSATTRPIRATETDGVDYHFMDGEAFEALREQDAFAEWAMVHGNYYGTLKSAIHEAWRNGQHVFFDIDYQGAIQLQKRFKHEAVSVLVVPPTLSQLEARLRNRATDSDEVIEHRLKAARHELEQYHIFDYIIVNDDFELACEELKMVYQASLLRTSIQHQRVLSMFQN